MKELKWLLAANGCEGKSPIFMATDLRQGEANASLCSGIMLKNNDTSVE
jgi:hypothetical protein